MKEQLANRKLGRGLSALLGDNYQDKLSGLTSDSNTEDKVQEIPVNRIVKGTYQPRQHFDSNELNELSRSIKENGVLQPIILRKSPQNQNNYEIIAGERRFRASQLAGLKSVPAIVREISDNKALELAIVENIQRSDLNAIEEATSYQRLIDDFGHKQEKIAEKIGRSRSYVTNSLRLLMLPNEVQKMVQKGSISASHARTLINCQDPVALANKIVNQNLSVRDLEVMVQNNNTKAEVKIASSQSKAKKAQRVRLAELTEQISQILGGLKVKVRYDAAEEKGQVTFFYKDLAKLEKMINNLSRKK